MSDSRSGSQRSLRAELRDYVARLGKGLFVFCGGAVVAVLLLLAEMLSVPARSVSMVVVFVVATWLAPFWAFRSVREERDRLQGSIDDWLAKAETQRQRQEHRDELLKLAARLSALQERAVALAESLSDLSQERYALSTLRQTHAEPNRAESWWTEVLGAVAETEYERHFSEYTPLTTTGDGFESASKKVVRRAGLVAKAIDQIHEDARRLI